MICDTCNIITTASIHATFSSSSSSLWSTSLLLLQLLVPELLLFLLLLIFILRQYSIVVPHASCRIVHYIALHSIGKITLIDWMIIFFDSVHDRSIWTIETTSYWPWTGSQIVHLRICIYSFIRICMYKWFDVREVSGVESYGQTTESL